MITLRRVYAAGRSAHYMRKHNCKTDVDADAVTNVDADVDVALPLLSLLPHSGASKPADRISPLANPVQCQHRRMLASSL